MPMYEYRCPHCGEQFELLRPVSERERPCECPRCRRRVKPERLSSLFAATASGRGGSASACSTSSGFG